VPFLLAGSAPKSEGPGPSISAPSAADTSGVGEIKVVSDDTQVRDYRKRLLGREKNPFDQHFTAPQLDGAQLGESTTTVPTSTDTGGASLPEPSGSTTGSTSTSSAGSTPSSGAVGGTDVSDGSPTTTGSGSGDTETEVRTITYAVDVRIVRNGHRRTRRDARELAKLPSEKVPVVMYMGASRDGKKALFLVSDRVNSVFGDVRCLVGSDSCQLLLLEPGLPVTFVYGALNHRYRVKLLKLERVAGHPVGQHSKERR
jgi:hypothetical protein